MGPEALVALEAAAPSLAVAAGGTMLQMQAQQEAADSRRGVLNRQLERDTTSTNKAIDLVQQEGQRFDQQARLDGLQQQEKKSYDQTQADLQGAGGATIAGAGDAGAVSSDYLKTKAQRAIDEGSRLTAVAREAAKSRAPSMLVNDDALSRANLAGGLQSLWGSNKNMASATGLDAESVTEPGYGALGKIASLVGTAAAGGALSKAGGLSSMFKPGGGVINGSALNTAGINFGAA